MRPLLLALVSILLVAPPPTGGGAEASPGSAVGCPSEEDLRAQILDLEPLLDLGSRSQRFGVATPLDLYLAAARKIERPRLEHQGHVGLAVVFTELPVEDLWRAVNDEDHFDLGNYSPVQHSEVVDGRARMPSRLVFQWYSRLGFGRWWVSRVEMNCELFRTSSQRLWEVFWEDRIGEALRTEPPVAEIADRLRPLESSQGAWLLGAFGPECTSIEYFTRSDPGGAAALLQPLVVDRALGRTVEGIVRMARRHLGVHPDLEFVRPDGTPLPSFEGDARPAGGDQLGGF